MRTRRTTRQEPRNYIGGILKPTKAMRSLSTPAMHQLINRHPRIFRAGNYMTQSTLRNMWSIPPLNVEGLSVNDTVRMVKDHQFALLNAYTRLNKLLALRGLVIRQSNNRYNICNINQARDRVQGLLLESDKKDRTAARLSAGIRRYSCVWSPLSEIELERNN